MASVNKVIIVGNLGRDPETRFMPSGGAVCNVSIATSRNWKDKASGERKEETEWHRVVFFDRLAEIAGEYLKKGSSVYIEGRLQTRKYTDKDGVEKYSTEVIAQEMQMLGGRGSGGEDQDRAPAQERAASGAGRNAPSGGAAAKRTSTEFDKLDDDIPF